ncbi:hypothetical protein JCM11641_006020 [Rhodosporidiobolus odoratus]
MNPLPQPADDPPEVDLGGSANSDPAVAWASAYPRPVKVSPSQGSVRSTASKAQLRFQEAMDRGKQIRWAQFQQREKEMEQLEKDELARMRARSEAGSRATAPTVAGDEGDLEVLIRQQEEAKARAELLERIIRAKQSSLLPPRPQLPVPVQPTAPTQILPSSPQSEYEELVTPSPSPVATAPRFTDISLKKVSAPKAWQGDFNYRRREGFIKSASGYLASVRVGLTKEISSSGTPQAHLALRSLFSSESKGNFLSAVDWFDAIDRDHLYLTPQMIFSELRAHWVDDAAAEDNFRRYRQAKQGALKVREFGPLVEQLAFDCFDRVISDEDRASTFREGLNSGAKDFILQVEAAQSAAFGTPAKMGFKKIVQVASAYDSVESRRSTSSSASQDSSRNARSKANPSSSPSNPSSSSSSPSSPSSSTSAPSSQTRKSWTENAQDWQATHAAKDKERWFRKETRPTSSMVRCFNCCRESFHVSSGCPNPRGDPRSVIVAAVRPKLSPASPSVSSSPDVTTSLEALPEESFDDEGLELSPKEGKANGV